MPSTAERIELAVAPALRYINKLGPIERLIEGEAAITACLETAGRIAAVRRSAVRELRMQGWKLEEIANELGVTKQRVAQIERGK